MRCFGWYGMNLFPVGLLHRLTTVIAPLDVVAGGLLLAVVVVLGVGFWRGGRAFSFQVPVLMYLALGVVGFLPPGGLHLPVFWRYLLAGGAVAALMVACALQRTVPQGQEEEAGARRAGRVAWIYVGTILIVSSLFIFHQLRDYPGTLLVWESPVSSEFSRSFQGGETVGQFARNRLLWDDGLMSRGEKSLLYGVPTYALLKNVEFSTLTLRVVSALAALATTLLMFLIVRRFFGPAMGAVAAGLLAFNACFLFYARYGTLSAATLMTVVLALGATWWFLFAERYAWLKGAVCGLALCLATFHYAPGRLVVLVLLAIATGFVLFQRSKWGWSRLLGLLLLWAAVVGLWLFESRHDHARLFLKARGEQYAGFVKDPYYIRLYLGRDINPHALTRSDKVQILARVLKTTIPQYTWFFTPGPAAVPPGREVLDLDPPRIKLFFGPLAVFALWGFLYSLRRVADPRHAALVAWVVLCTPPLLLTNRVDTHRIFLFVIPVTLWIARGLRQAARLVDRAGMPSWVSHALGIVLALALVQNAAWQLFYPSPRPSPFCKAAAAELEKLPGPVLLATDEIDHREVAWLNIQMMERQRRDPARRGGLLNGHLVHQIRDGRAEVNPRHVWILLDHLRDTTLILAPAHRFHKVASRLHRIGVVTTYCGTFPGDFYVVRSRHALTLPAGTGPGLTRYPPASP